MRRMITAVVACAFLASAAQAATTLTWDFNDGTQGWTMSGAPGAWGAFPAGSPTSGTGALYLPDSSWAYMDVPETNQFRYEADIYWGAFNMMTRSGLSYRATHLKDTTTPNGAAAHSVTGWFEGRDQNSERMIFRDSYSGNTDTNMRWFRNAANVVQNPGSAHIILDYNYTTPGKVLLYFTPYSYTPHPDNSPSPYTWVTDLDINDATGEVHTINRIRLGGDFSWAQSWFDNVSFTYIPEPATLSFLAIGSLAMLRRRRAV